MATEIDKPMFRKSSIFQNSAEEEHANSPNTQYHGYLESMANDTGMSDSAFLSKSARKDSASQLLASNNQQNEEETVVPSSSPPMSPFTSWADTMSSKEEAFKRFINSFRLKMEDDFLKTGASDGLYAGESALTQFKAYIGKAKGARIFPNWWVPSIDDDKLINIATTDSYCNINLVIDKDEIKAVYGPRELFELKNLALMVDRVKSDEE